MRAYVLIKAEPHHTMGIMKLLQNEPGISEASLIHGPYDCVVHLEGKNLDDINEAVLRIREIPGVAETLTCLVVRSWQRGK
jgi:DNA-binding Lrp family transcriptional regulator